MDSPSQVHAILKNYISYIQAVKPHLTVELVKIIFNLALSVDNKAYKLRSSNEEIIAIIEGDFEHLGLVEFTNTDKTKFFITKYM